MAINENENGIMAAASAKITKESINEKYHGMDNESK
jgi:hypothetical protein